MVGEKSLRHKLVSRSNVRRHPGVACMRKTLLFLAFAMSGGSVSAAAQPPAPPPGPQIVVFISPMGEPFRRAQGPGEPVERWFQGADTDHDGALSVTEFQADAAHF